MEITNTTPSKLYKSTNNPSFGAIPRSSYLLKNSEKVCIYELEKSDLPFIKMLRNSADEYATRNFAGDFAEKNSDANSPENLLFLTKKIIFEKALDACVDVLEAPKEIAKKTSIYVAVANEKLCGIVIGGVPKINKKGNIVHSSRKNPRKHETEGDFFVTWHNKEYSGTGKALLCEMFNGTLAKGFKSFYAKSEVPQHSDAIYFYQKYGFKPILGMKQKKFGSKSESHYFKGEYFHNDDMMIPVIINRKSMQAAINKVSSAMERKPYTESPQSCCLRDMIRE